MYNILSNSHVVNFCFGLFTSDDAMRLLVVMQWVCLGCVMDSFLMVLVDVVSS